MKLHQFADLADIESSQLLGVRNVLLLADDAHVANVVQDHINAFKVHSRHRIRVVNPIRTKVSADIIDPPPDVILIHYSIFILGEYYLPAPWAQFVRSFPGGKAQIIQDEHRHVNAMKARMAELGIGAVFSSLEVHNLPRVYGGDMLDGTRFYSCLPGYIADGFKSVTPPPIAERPLDVIYRGRELIFKLGRAAQEKSTIGDQMLALAGPHALNVDITSKEERRIYGHGWTDFLMSGRTTLGVEGGVSIFDFDDEIEAASRTYLASHPSAGFDEVWQAVLAPHEGNIVHRTITPKLFEAVATKTALVLYPGRYRGILEPNRHYIPFARDASNADEVIAKIKDTAFLQELVDRTHADLIDREDLSTRFYVRQVDAVLDLLHQQDRTQSSNFSKQREQALQSALAAQVAADDEERRRAAEQAELVQRQLDDMRHAAEAAARQQAQIEREHAEFVQRQQAAMQEAVEQAAREQARIDREHAEFVQRQHDETRRAIEQAARDQERIDREHREFVERQRNASQASPLGGTSLHDTIKQIVKNILHRK